MKNVYEKYCELAIKHGFENLDEIKSLLISMDYIPGNGTFPYVGEKEVNVYGSKFDTNAVLIIKPGFELFHLSPKNNTEARKAFENDDYEPFDILFEETAENCVNTTTSLLNTKHFGITEEFPYYFGVNNIHTGASKYVTNKYITLLLCNEKASLIYEDLENQVDGIIYMDSGYFFVTLFQPYKCVNFGSQYILEIEEKYSENYPKEMVDKEFDIITKFTECSFLAIVKNNKIELFRGVHCDLKRETHYALSHLVKNCQERYLNGWEKYFLGSCNRHDWSHRPKDEK